ncbi:MAG TPA: hypothetical protein VMM15_07005 [Bradyrhizobium sp.]|nr:hypothetical protein [Bradyrhizobium sp.]
MNDDLLVHLRYHPTDGTRKLGCGAAGDDSFMGAIDKALPAAHGQERE